MKELREQKTTMSLGKNRIYNIFTNEYGLILIEKQWVTWIEWDNGKVDKFFELPPNIKKVSV